MKNIHLIPTTRPSRLQLSETGKLYIIDRIGYYGTSLPQHLYITSSEEIREGDWACHKVITNDEYQLVKCNLSNKTSIQEHWQKIILTTDPDLIADGVQAIDDEFLEWFVKNPTCESVEVALMNKGYNTPEDVPYQECYRIILPKEECEIIDISDHDWIGDAVDNLNDTPTEENLFS